MGLKRTTVYADAEDLAVIKAAAAREGVAEAEIIREAIHLAALSKRTWDTPLSWPKFRSGDPGTAARAADTASGDIWDEKARAYEETKRRLRA
ncbi:CopG family transcriptional regulator [Streptomyces sp. B1866]|uniref:ribbon-helix-helix domain-containing protein n=1 Tax=Streptomyces sp. B1866 TaxID=3075431 RepID=UPI00288ECA0C|nr:CopG family transcriptional regulator [Streptomyces sp. B1866]MDT3398879.1 CopG family transcriptional regulator [Streptomyces sp. B1866]